MITLRKGPAGPELRHKEFQEDCELLGKILSWEYNLDESTLALKGYLEGSWDAGEIRIEFDLIVGGDSDRLSSTNRRSMAFSYGNNN
jgi:hypothetical protein